MSHRPKVSVIIPIYNVDSFIEHCARTLFEQTLDSIEYIFVDDCSKDNSMNVLNQVIEDYPNRKKQIKIIHLPTNSRQAAARTAGMEASTGQYIIHCDPDDWVELNAYEFLYNKAVLSQADIVTCRYFVHDGHTTRIEGKTFSASGIECLLKMEYDSSLCIALIKNQLLKEHNIRPFPGIDCGEDLNVRFRALYFSKRVCAMENVLYHYNLNNVGSITHKDSRYLIENQTKKNISAIEAFVNSTKDDRLLRALNYLKLKSKRSLLWPWRSDMTRDVDFWCSLWKESHKNISTYPDFNINQKIIFSIFSHSPKILKLYFRYLDWKTS